MKAVVITRPGGPEVLEVREVPDPSPGRAEVLVRVRASAVNRADILQRMGRYPAPAGAPARIPGLEFAGEVIACGESVRTRRPGDRVMGILGGGGYATRVALAEGLCLPVPDGVDWASAAALPEGLLTAFDALERHGQRVAGQTVLIHAAASGVGTAAVQLALAAGARVVALSRTAAKRARLRELGADAALDPGADGLATSIVEASGGGVDVVLDLVGAATLPLDLEVLRERGRVIVIGLLGGSRASLDLALVMRKRATLVGSVLRSRSLEEKIELTREFRHRVWPLLASGRVRAIVDRCLPLEQAAEAHAVIERNENFGKIVLTVTEP